jgi:hypothetical protein
MPKWIPVPGHDINHIVEDYIDEKESTLARLEYFGHGCYYPMALNAKTGNLERGGPMLELRDALAWAERVANGQMIEGDERSPFYYTAGDT